MCLFVVLSSAVYQSHAADLLWAPTLLEHSSEREKEFRVFNAWLTDQTKLSLSVVIEPDYDRLMQRFEQDEIAMLWVGPNMAQKILINRPDAQVLAITRDAQGNTDYRCVLFVRKAYLGDAKQAVSQSLALTQPLSTCGSIGAERVASYVGVSSVEKNRRFTGSHQNAIVSVMLGETQAGIVADHVFERFSWLPLRKLVRSSPLPAFVWLINPRLVTAEQQQALRLAFTKTQQAETSADWYVAYRHGFETDISIIAQRIDNLMQGKN
jgi:phosphonate transport system substrate-binding protein